MIASRLNLSYRAYGILKSFREINFVALNKGYSSGRIVQKHIMSGILSEEKVKNIELEFDKAYYSLVKDLTNFIPPDAKDSKIWFTKALNYNVPHGKKNRGLSVVFSYQCLVKGKMTEEDIKIASMLGWCIELLQAFFLVADDIMDHSLLRRGHPCWYTREEVGLNAVNDVLFIESAIYFLLRKHLRHKQYYTDIVDLFHETTLLTITGQNLDTISPKGTAINLFTVERYNAIVKYKTAYYSFHLPVACALYMTGINDPEIHGYASTILLKMGEYFQIQDDFLDCYGKPDITGKIGTDIEENKCSWLVVQALQMCNGDQKSILEANYGCKEGCKVEQVKKIYRELGLEELFKKYEEDSYSELLNLIDKLPNVLPKEMFLISLAKIYKRHK